MTTSSRSDVFPIFKQHPDLIYLDAAATCLKPELVIDAVTDYLGTTSTNVGRGLYPLAETTTARYEAVRTKVARFIGATPEEIIFTAGTTDSLNRIATLLASRLRPGDNIVTTELEHHSNSLPFRELSLRTSSAFRVVPFSSEGLLEPQTVLKAVDSHTRIVTFSAISNVLGGINPVSDIVKAIRAVAKEAIIVIDAAQAVGHIPVDVSAWDADFVAFSGHKMYGPTGIGILFGKHDLLESLTPTVFGGGMVADSCGDPIVYRESPVRFEAGTPNIEGVFGLGAAIEFLQKTGINQIREHDIELSRYAMEKLQETFGTSIHILGPKDPAKRGGLISFVLEGVHPHDLAHLLGEKQICIRAGEHCAAPLHRALHIPASARISFGIYNSKEDIDQFVDEMKSIQAVLGGLRPR